MATTTPRDHTCRQHQLLGDGRDLGVADTRRCQAISGEVGLPRGRPGAGGSPGANHPRRIA